MRISEAIILAGGKGSRLKDLTQKTPKPMMLVDGKPFLEIIFHYLIQQNINRVILSVGHYHKKIINYFGEKYKSINIVYNIENAPLGTGGAILNSMNKAYNEDIFVINGDTLFNINLKNLSDLHYISKSKLTIALKKKSRTERFGKISLDEKNLISKVSEKKNKGSGLINGGVYLINKSLFNSRDYGKSFSFEYEILEKISSSDCFRGLVFDDLFYDIGTPADLKKAQVVLKKIKFK
jgi:D-glycero-alpha-D-manno-heptose 1-phosphate guanylyltransferase